MGELKKKPLSVPKLRKAGRCGPFCVNYALMSSNALQITVRVNQGVILYSYSGAVRVQYKHAAQPSQRQLLD